MTLVPPLVKYKYKCILHKLASQLSAAVKKRASERNCKNWPCCFWNNFANMTPEQQNLKLTWIWKLKLKTITYENLTICWAADVYKGWEVRFDLFTLHACWSWILGSNLRCSWMFYSPPHKPLIPCVGLSQSSFLSLSIFLPLPPSINSTRSQQHIM